MRKYAMITVVTIACLTAFSFALAGGREYIPITKTPNLQTGYIEKIEQKDNQFILSIDNIDWYEGDQAAQKFRELEGDSGMDAPPDGYYIINNDSKLKDLPIANDAVVLMQIYNRTGDMNEADIVWDEQISVDKFVELLSTDDDFELKNFPYHVTVKGGEIIRIVQQYIP